MDPFLDLDNNNNNNFVLPNSNTIEDIRTLQTRQTELTEQINSINTRHTDLLEQLAKITENIKKQGTGFANIINSIIANNTPSGKELASYMMGWHQLCGRQETRINNLEAAIKSLLAKPIPVAKPIKEAKIFYLFKGERNPKITEESIKECTVGTNYRLSNYKFNKVIKCGITIGTVKNRIHDLNNTFYPLRFSLIRAGVVSYASDRHHLMIEECKPWIAGVINVYSRDGSKSVEIYKEEYALEVLEIFKKYYTMDDAPLERIEGSVVE